MINYKPIVISAALSLSIGLSSGVIGTVQFLGLDWQSIQQLRQDKAFKLIDINDYTDINKTIEAFVPDAETTAKLHAYEADQGHERTSQWLVFFTRISPVMFVLLLVGAWFSVRYFWLRRKLDKNLEIHKERVNSQYERKEKIIN